MTRLRKVPQDDRVHEVQVPDAHGKNPIPLILVGASLQPEAKGAHGVYVVTNQLGTPLARVWQDEDENGAPVVKIHYHTKTAAIMQGKTLLAQDGLSWTLYPGSVLEVKLNNMVFVMGSPVVIAYYRALL